MIKRILRTSFVLSLLFTAPRLCQAQDDFGGSYGGGDYSAAPAPAPDDSAPAADIATGAPAVEPTLAAADPAPDLSSDPTVGAGVISGLAAPDLSTDPTVGAGVIAGAAAPDLSTDPTVGAGVVASQASPSSDLAGGDPLIAPAPKVTLSVLGEADLPAIDVNNPAVSAALAQPAENVTTGPAAVDPKTAQNYAASLSNSDSQLQQIIDSTGKKQSGQFRDAADYASQYGGAPEDYKKMQSRNNVNTSEWSSNYGDQIKTHWVENKATGEVYDVKTKLWSTPEAAQAAGVDINSGQGVRGIVDGTSGDPALKGPGSGWAKSDLTSSLSTSAAAEEAANAARSVEFGKPSVPSSPSSTAAEWSAAAKVGLRGAALLTSAEVAGWLTAPEVMIPLTLAPYAIEAIQAYNDYNFAHPMVLPNGDKVVTIFDGSSFVNGKFQPALIPMLPF